jgi:hypothetical protein
MVNTIWKIDLYALYARQNPLQLTISRKMYHITEVVVIPAYENVVNLNRRVHNGQKVDIRKKHNVKNVGFLPNS